MTEANVTDLGYEAIRLVEASKDSVTDDMVSRLAGTLTDALDLVDRINSSGIATAIPVLAQLVNNGDLERIAGLARLYAAAEDSVTDDMIGRLGDTAGGMMVLADKVARSRVEEALPIVDDMIDNGDLKRASELVRLVGAAEDAMTDDMVGRLAELGGEAVSVLDRLNRSGVGKLVEVVEKLDANGGLDIIADTLPKATEQLGMLRDMMACLECAREEVNTTPAAGGGIGGLMKIMLNKQNQEFLRFVMAVGRQFQERCVKSKAAE